MQGEKSAQAQHCAGHAPRTQCCTISHAQASDGEAAGRLLPALEDCNPDEVEEVPAVYVGQGGYLPMRVRACLDFLVERVDLGQSVASAQLSLSS